MSITRQAQLGLLTLACAAGVLVAFFLFARLGPGRAGYRIGVHFPGAAGVAPGAEVFLSGVNIGSVDRVRILADGSVDIILAIRRHDIPKDARFSIQTSLTGAPSIAIAPPPPHVVKGVPPTPLPHNAVLEKRVLPLEQQPVGTIPLSVEQLLSQSRSLGNGAQSVLTHMHGYKSSILGNLERSRSNAAATPVLLRATSASLMRQISSTMQQVNANETAAVQALRRHDQRRAAMLASSLSSSAKSMNASLDSLRLVTRDPQVRANVRASAANLRTAMANAKTLQSQGFASGETRAQLADAQANLRAAMEKLRSLLKP
jgi:ABC-type transporter Mla subunit MlaD